MSKTKHWLTDLIDEQGICITGEFDYRDKKELQTAILDTIRAKLPEEWVSADGAWQEGYNAGIEAVKEALEIE